METRVYIVSKSVAQKVTDDEHIRRHGEANQYDPSALGVDEEGTILVVKGDGELFEHDLLSKLEEFDKASKVLAKIEEMDESAAAAVGNLF